MQTILLLLAIQALLIAICTAFETDLSAYVNNSSKATRILGSSGFSFGSMLNSIGDFNGDGIDDIIIGSPYASAAYVLYGKSGGLSNDINLSNLSISQGVKINGNISNGDVSAAGDVNKDGLADIMISIPGRRTVYVIYGKFGGLEEGLQLTGALNLSKGFYIEGRDNHDIRGQIGAAGDFNGDGVDDIYFMSSSTLFVIYGRKGGLQAHIQLGSSLDLSQGLMVQTQNPSFFYATFADDFNQDGVNDIIMAGHEYGLDFVLKGDVYVIYGKKNGFQAHIDLKAPLDISQGFQIIIADQIYSTIRMSSAGDINNDGVNDIALSVSVIGGNENEKSVFIIYGRQGRNQTNIDVRNMSLSQGFTIKSKNERLIGLFLSPAGDLNDDGIDDFLTGGQTDGESGGHVCIFYGKKGNFESNFDITKNTVGFPGTMIYSYEELDGFGHHAVTADLNNDGRLDLIVAAPNVTIPKMGVNGTFYVLYSPNPPSPNVSSGSPGLSIGLIIALGCACAIIVVGILLHIIPKLRGARAKIGPTEASGQAKYVSP